MIENILDLYKSNNYEDIIITEDIKLLVDYIIQDKKEMFNFKIIEDARSATFFGIGRINVTRKPVMLIMSSDEVASSLTGLTEANYQSLPLIIISIGDKEPKLNEECFKYVTKKVISDIKDKESLNNELETYFNGKWFKPLLIQIVDKNEIYYKKNDRGYCDIVEYIINSTSSNSQIFVEEILNEDSINIARNKNISVNYRNSSYGVVSCFLGHATVNDNIQYLITTYSKIVRDINAFNMRGIKRNVVIIYIKSMNIEQKLDLWFTRNNFDFSSVKLISEIEGKLTKPSERPIIIEYLVDEGR